MNAPEGRPRGGATQDAGTPAADEQRGREDRITAAFARGRETGRPLIVPFVTAGYPSPQHTVPLVRGLVEAGADLVEIGIPFSDPLADGPTIQRSSEAALKAGMTVGRVLESLEELRADHRLDSAPLVLMGYCNPIFRYGLGRFLDRAAAVGVDGFIVADLPPEEAAEYRSGCVERGLSATFLVAPNAPDGRILAVDEASTHFSYCVTVTGVTGARAAVERRTVDFLKRMRSLADKPFVVGFGVKAPQHVERLGPWADGVVVGSALIDAMEGADDPVTAARELIRPLRAAAEGLAGAGRATEGEDE